MKRKGKFKLFCSNHAPDRESCVGRTDASDIDDDVLSQYVGHNGNVGGSSKFWKSKFLLNRHESEVITHSLVGP